MQDFNKQPHHLFKRIDKSVFENIDKFKLSPAYNGVQDFYNSLEEEQQKVFKAAVMFLIFLVPLLCVGILYWSNASLRTNLESRISIIQKANEIIGKRQSLRAVAPDVLSPNPIDGQSMMTSRLSNLLSSSGVDLSKIQVNNYEGNLVTESVMRSEADFQFNNVSTDELMNILTAMIQREKFRVESIDIKRNAETNLLQVTFHAIHLSSAETTGEE